MSGDVPRAEVEALLANMQHLLEEMTSGGERTKDRDAKMVLLAKAGNTRFWRDKVAKLLAESSDG